MGRKIESLITTDMPTITLPAYINMQYILNLAPPPYSMPSPSHPYLPLTPPSPYPSSLVSHVSLLLCFPYAHFYPFFTLYFLGNYFYSTSFIFPYYYRFLYLNLKLIHYTSRTSVPLVKVNST